MNLIYSFNILELFELFLGSRRLGHLKNVEPNGLTEWSAFTDSHCVANGNISVEVLRFCIMSG